MDPHPLIRALLDTLPARGEDFGPEQRERFLATMWANLNYLYGPVALPDLDALAQHPARPSTPPPDKTDKDQS